MLLTKAVFWPDGGAGYGFGHLNRCFEIANALPWEKDEICFFLPDDDRVRDIALNHGVRNIFVHGDRDEENISAMSPWLLFTDWRDRRDVNWEALRQGRTVIASMDDLGRSSLKSDIVFNPNIYADSLNYGLLPEDTRVFKGINYCVLRRKILGLRRNGTCTDTADRRKRILVSFGGNDRNSLTLRVCGLLKDFDDMDVDVILPAFRDPSEVVALAGKTGHIKCRSFSENVEDLFVNADVVVCGGGTMLAELAYLRCVSVCIPQADYEEFNASFYEREGTTLNLKNSGVNDETIVKTVRSAINNPKLRKDVADRGRSLIDGMGVQRIAEITISAVRERFNEKN